jgi:hypothetical protein
LTREKPLKGPKKAEKGRKLPEKEAKRTERGTANAVPFPFIGHLLGNLPWQNLGKILWQMTMSDA